MFALWFVCAMFQFVAAVVNFAAGNTLAGVIFMIAGFIWMGMAVIFDS